jgi:hypothetical protein
MGVNKMMDAFNYMFSNIPNNKEGKLLVKLMKKYLNKNRYNMRTRGQFLIDSEKPNWRKYQMGQPIAKSKCLRIYIVDELVKERSSQKHHNLYETINKVNQIKALSNEVININNNWGV